MRTSMRTIKHEIKWALVFMLVTLAWMMIERITGLHDRHIAQHAFYTNFFAVLAVLVYVLALLDKRKNYYQGYMSYSQGVKSGLLITLFIVLLSPLTQYLTHTLISPQYFSNIATCAVSIEQMTAAEAASYFSLQNYILLSMMMASVMGFVTTLIVALIVRRTP